ncbi:AraC family transcriptional regulator [Paraburkholderia sp. UYCP14C]|uniref:AraC family transcriptional regulator n=1 Tax=Paraburkholderia sp. UYCP14C TaxID=2511130 RepID=UPI0010227FB2|nr:AraC family transcriptional regulator [Paraburkholderia sp. UYCP14C]RZF31081.1 AraC family transcriptional regulator [Paraburkholderia sp. UYCP14C]
MNESDHRARYETRLARVLDHIYDHLDDPLDIGRLAEIACLSPYHWHRIYQAMYGETVAMTVRRLRLHRAAGFLANSSMPIALIAERSGYSSLQSFSRTFRAVFGVPPAQYRKQGTQSRFRPALSGEDQMTTIREVVIRYVEPMEILSVDHVGPYMQIGKAFDALFGWLAKHNLLAAQMRMIGVYFDDAGVVEEQALRSKAGVLLPGPVMAEVASAVAMDGGVSVTRIRGGEYAVLRHVGPYSDMRAAYEWLYGTWLVQSGREAADAPVFEEYLNSPKETAPAELITEICLPLG